MVSGAIRTDQVTSEIPCSDDLTGKFFFFRADRGDFSPESHREIKVLKGISLFRRNRESGGTEQGKARAEQGIGADAAAGGVDRLAASTFRASGMDMVRAWHGQSQC